MIYFTSDTHFNHDREFIWGLRGFKSVEEMNETLINNWNNTVKPEDHIFVLGDFFLGTDLDFVISTINNLTGNIHLVIGNHDTPAKLQLYQECEKIQTVERATQMQLNGLNFYVSHYPSITANLHDTRETAVFNLHGHTHSKNKFYEGRPYMYNVAVDAQNNMPVSIEQIVADIDAEIAKCRSFLV